MLLGAGNAAGGYVVTERMLEMFKSSRRSRGRQQASALTPACRSRLIIEASYFAAAILFLLGLQAHGLAGHRAQRHPWAGVGMLVATLATFLLRRPGASAQPRR